MERVKACHLTPGQSSIEHSVQDQEPHLRAEVTTASSRINHLRKLACDPGPARSNPVMSQPRMMVATPIQLRTSVTRWVTSPVSSGLPKLIVKDRDHHAAVEREPTQPDRPETTEPANGEHRYQIDIAAARKMDEARVGQPADDSGAPRNARSYTRVLPIQKEVLSHGTDSIKDPTTMSRIRSVPGFVRLIGLAVLFGPVFVRLLVGPDDLPGTWSHQCGPSAHL